MENMILQPIVVGGQTFKNRIMFPPLTTGYEKNGMISEQDMGFYTRLYLHSDFLPGVFLL